MAQPDIGDRIAAVCASVRAHLEEELEMGEQGIAVPRPRATPARQTAAAAAIVPAATATETGGSVNQGERRRLLAELAREAAGCTRCELHRSRTNSVFARGDPDTDLVFVGEGPGFDEDQQGVPFVGQAGQLLDRMIAAMGYDREAVYICNVVKCHPPGNRTPTFEEARACEPFLVSQLELLRPGVIVALGKCASENLGAAAPSGPWRGRWARWRSIPVMPTYHPAFLLRSPKFKKVVWEDLQQVLKRLGRQPRR